MHDAEHDFKNSLFKAIDYEIRIQIFSGAQISCWSVVGWSLEGAFGWWSVGQWSVFSGWLVGWSVVLRKPYEQISFSKNI